MHVYGIKPNSISMFSVLLVFVVLLALEQGTQIHNYAILRHGLESDAFAGNGLVNLY